MSSAQQFYIVLLGMIGSVILYTLIGGVFQRYNFHYIHETGAGILLGVIFGIIVYFLHDFTKFQFNEELFFLALLPPMIFSGGYNLKKKQFFKNIKQTLVYGLIGTLVCFFIVFALTFAINKLEWVLSSGENSQVIILSTALMIKYSATISASDAVAALTIIRPSQHPKLFSVIFGEGMINDAVAIILFKVVGNVFEEGEKHISNLTSGEDGIDALIILKIIWEFFYTVVVSIFIGVVIALFCSWIFKKVRFLCNPISEVVIVYLFGILSYLISQVIGMSGVLTVLVAGVVMAHFNFYNLSMTGHVATGTTYQSISFIAQAIVFIYLGLSFMYYVTNYTISLSFFGMQLLICIISRCIAIFGLGYIVKAISKWVLTANEMTIVLTAGTIRGSVAFALILTIQVPQDATKQEKMSVQIIKSTVLFMVFLTTIVLGGLMPWIIKLFLGSSTNEEIYQNGIGLLVDCIQNQEEKIQKQNKPQTFWKKIDERYLKPLLIFDYQNRNEDIKNWKKFLKMNSPHYKGAELTGIMKANIRQTVKHEISIYKSKGGDSGTISMLGKDHI